MHSASMVDRISCRIKACVGPITTNNRWFQLICGHYVLVVSSVDRCVLDDMVVQGAANTLTFNVKYFNKQVIYPLNQLVQLGSFWR